MTNEEAIMASEIESLKSTIFHLVVAAGGSVDVSRRQLEQGLSGILLEIRSDPKDGAVYYRTTRPANLTPKVKIQSVDSMTEEEKAQRFAPRVTVEFEEKE